jgi:hypothetical protein
VPSVVVGNIGREGRSQPLFEARLIHENHPIKDSAEYGGGVYGVRVAERQPDPSKRDEIGPRLYARIPRICGDLATSDPLKLAH